MMKPHENPNKIPATQQHFVKQGNNNHNATGASGHPQNSTNDSSKGDSKGSMINPMNWFK